MARPTVIPKLRALIEDLLEIKQAAWEDQPEPEKHRKPTLLFTNDHKVDVRNFSRELVEFAAQRGIKLTMAVARHIHENEVLHNPINDIAAVQGIKVIGSRKREKEKDDAALSAIKQLNKRIKSQSEGHVQARARVAYLERELAEERAENQRLRILLGHLQQTGSVIRTGNIVE